VAAAEPAPAPRPPDLGLIFEEFHQADSSISHRDLTTLS
jgi:hypothetical protein